MRIIIKVLDENDNTPTFKDSLHGPIIAVIPQTASYGYNVYKVEAVDQDSGINGDIKYSLINEVTNIFAIDSTSGQIRTVGPLWRSNQRVFGLDILAKDRKGQEDGKSSIVNMLVSILKFYFLKLVLIENPIGLCSGRNETSEIHNVWKCIGY